MDTLYPYVTQVVNGLIGKHRAEQATWPDRTDCDRLDETFADLEARGIDCRQNYSSCAICGEAEIRAEVARLPAGAGYAHGYVFYDARETEAAILGHGIHLTFGAVTGGMAESTAIGCAIVAALQQAGLRAEWSGDHNSAIYVEIDWKRRAQWS